MTLATDHQSRITTCTDLAGTAPVRRSFGGTRKANGIALVRFLAIIFLLYGVYALALKPSKKIANDKTVATESVKPRIVIYTTPACEPCDRAKAWMTQRRFAFEERNVEGSPAFEEELKNYKSRIVPVIVVNDEPLYGFQAAYLEESLRNATHQAK